jgi:beta-lactamase superfamily II metal-dependent hydrolase
LYTGHHGDTNIVDTPEGDVVVIDSDYNYDKLSSEIDERLDEGDDLHLMTTHPDEDHYSNNQQLIEEYDVAQHHVPAEHRREGNFPTEKKSIHYTNGTGWNQVTADDTLTIGGAEFDITNPPPEEPDDSTLKTDDRNENSLGVTVSYADSADPDPEVEDYTARFNGDKKSEGEQSELERMGDELKRESVDDADSGHHGDENANTEEFKRTEDADHEYISADLYDEHGHPNGETFEQYSDGTNVYWGGLHGDFQHDGEGDPSVENEFSSDPEDLQAIRNRVENLDQDDRYRERNEQYDPHEDDPVQEVRKIFDETEGEKSFDEVYDGEVDQLELSEDGGETPEPSDTDQTDTADRNAPEVESDGGEMTGATSGDGPTPDDDGSVTDDPDTDAPSAESGNVDRDAQSSGEEVEDDLDSGATNDEGEEVAGTDPTDDDGEETDTGSTDDESAGAETDSGESNKLSTPEPEEGGEELGPDDSMATSVEAGDADGETGSEGEESADTNPTDDEADDESAGTETDSGESDRPTPPESEEGGGETGPDDSMGPSAEGGDTDGGTGGDDEGPGPTRR